MKLTTILIAIATMMCALTAGPTTAGEPAGDKADSVRDEAISRIIAWRAKSGEAVLKNNTDLDERQEWLTAEALLMAAYGINQDKEILDRGLALLTAQAKKDPTDPVAEFYRGEVLHWLDQPDEAKAAWQNAKKRAAALVKKDSKDARAQYYLGASLVRLREPASARRALKKAERAGWEKPMVDFQVGLSYILEQNWKAAKDSFDDVHELDPRFAHLYFYRGLAWDKLGHKDQLLDDLDQFVKLAPNSPEAKTARAILNR